MAWFNPRTWTVGETVTTAMMNGIRDCLKAIGDPWTTYTPTFASTIGDGAITGAYRLTGKTVNFRIHFTAGSSTTFTSMNFGLPPAAPAGWVVLTPVGTALMQDANVGTSSRTPGVAIIASSALVTVVGPAAQINTTSPWTWATGDIIYLSGVYEIA